MTALGVTLNMDAAPWAELRGKEDKIVGANIEKIGVLPNSMQSGRSTVQMKIPLHDGTIVIAQTSLRNFRMAAAAINASPLVEATDA